MSELKELFEMCVKAAIVSIAFAITLIICLKVTLFVAGLFFNLPLK